MISVDPGANGAIVFWEGKTIVDIADMPYVKNKLDIVKLKLLIGNPGLMVIEDVGTSPRSGVASAGSFLYNVGVLHAAAIFAGAALVKIRPQTWKAAVGLYGKPKSMSPSKAEEYYGDAYVGLIKQHKNRVDRSEAALIGAAYLKLMERKDGLR